MPESNSNDFIRSYKCYRILDLTYWGTLFRDLPRSFRGNASISCRISVTPIIDTVEEFRPEEEAAIIANSPCVRKRGSLTFEL